MDSSSSLKILSEIGRIITSDISSSWSEISVEAEIDGELADLCAWYIDLNGEEQYPNITKELINCFVELRRVSKNGQKGYWTKCLYRLSPDGKYSTKFSYEKARWL